MILVLAIYPKCDHRRGLCILWPFVGCFLKAYSIGLYDLPFVTDPTPFCGYRYSYIYLDLGALERLVGEDDVIREEQNRDTFNSASVV